MKLRTTLILLAIAVGLFAFIRFYERNIPTTKESEEGRPLMRFDRDAVDKILIKNDEDTIELRRDGVNWVMKRPEEDNADAAAVARLFSSLEMLQSKAEIGSEEIDRNKSLLREFGVAKSKVKLKLKGKGLSKGMTFGNTLPVEDTGYYVQVDGDPGVYVVTGDLKEQVQAEPEAFRDPRLSRLNVAEVEKVEIRTGAGAVEAVKDGGEWNLVRPLKARGDSQRIQDLAAKIINATITDFASANSANPMQYGLAEPRGTVTLSAQDQGEPTVLTIGSPVGDPDGEAQGTSLYVKLSTRDALLKLPSSLGEILETKPNDLRDRYFVRLNPDIVDRITISTPGNEPFVLARSGEDWMVLGEDESIPANSAKANALLSRIHNEKVVEFVSDVASELETYGLREPRITVAFSAYASENTAESKAGESEFLTIKFGKSEDGKVYARVEDEPFIVALDEAVLEDIGTQRGEWKTLQVFNRSADEVAMLQIQHKGSQPTTVTVEDGMWKSGEGVVDPVNVRSLVNTLVGLRAVRWVPDGDGMGFEKPTVTIQFDDAKLLVGGKTDEDLWYGRVDGEEGTFLISKPDYEALALNVLIPPADEASPAPKPVSSPAMSPTVTEPLRAPMAPAQ